MPFYRYKCEDCGKSTELFCSISERQELEISLKCEFCSSKKLSQEFKIMLANSREAKAPDSGKDHGSSCGGSCSSCGGGCF